MKLDLHRTVSNVPTDYWAIVASGIVSLNLFMVQFFSCLFRAFWCFVSLFFYFVTLNLYSLSTIDWEKFSVKIIISWLRPTAKIQHIKKKQQKKQQLMQRSSMNKHAHMSTPPGVNVQSTTTVSDT